MQKIVVEGSKKLVGSVKIQGSKNAVLPILAACTLCDGTSVIHNCPLISDVFATQRILEFLGIDCTFSGNTVIINSENISGCFIPDSLMRQMRSSSLFLGAMLGRTRAATVCCPGGCEIGLRPIDLHIAALKKMGAKVITDNGYICLKAEKGLTGAKIDLAFPSVGATENIILAAVTAKGTTEIRNAAKEPEICDLADFLNMAGAKIKGAGTDTIVITGTKRLKGTEYSVMPDRIVAATYMSAVAITGGSAELLGVDTSIMTAFTSVLSEAGCNIFDGENRIVIDAPNKLKSVSKVRTLVYPGFPTDAGPMLVSALSKAKGTSVFVETIFENRFRYIEELIRLGANIKTEGRVAVIEGVNVLSGANCKCSDLRGGAAIVVAALGAYGKSVISDICYIKRGYENIVSDLLSLGADIKEK